MFLPRSRERGYLSSSGTWAGLPPPGACPCPGWACWEQRGTHIPATSLLTPLGLGHQPHLHPTGAVSRLPPAPNPGQPFHLNLKVLPTVAVKGPGRTMGQRLLGGRLPMASLGQAPKSVPDLPLPGNNETGAMDF